MRFPNLSSRSASRSYGSLRLKHVIRGHWKEQLPLALKIAETGRTESDRGPDTSCKEKVREDLLRRTLQLYGNQAASLSA